MKFANYKFNGASMNNIGDNMQIIAVDYLYSQMGINKEDIVYIDKNDLPTYNGEYVILPVNMPLIDYRPGGICGWFSPKIIPAFLGLTLAKDTLLKEEVEYYKRFEPIGCRDERTMQTLRAYGIMAYLNGCITAALPKREINEKQNKIFIVDVSDKLMEYIPEEIKKEAVYVTHFYPGNLPDPKKVMQETYDRYKNEAKLVITSLLHCSSPCMAAGIPVVLAKEKCSYRMGWLDKLIPIYTENNFKDINWDPKPVEYEEHKKKILEVAIARLNELYGKYHLQCELSDFYENRSRCEYVVDAFESLKNYIDTNWCDYGKEYRYAVWGLTQMSELTHSYIQKKYPNAKLCHVYDKYKTVDFHGILSQSPENIKEFADETIFVTTTAATKEAKALFEQIGKPITTAAFVDIIK